MSIVKATEQIIKFLHSSKPEVMVLRGKWGTGKTYLWNKYFLQEAMSNKIPLSIYSYISLFGVKSVEELKEKISGSLTAISFINNRQSKISILGNLIDKFTRKSTKLTSTLIDSYLSKYNINSNILPALQKLLFLSVEKSIIVIDDFERKSSSLNSNDILGIISDLKELRKCKLVLIFNDEEFNEDDKLTYEKLREKVIDKEILLSPTPRECADIVLGNSEIDLKLRELIIKLNIKNIRIIHKIKNLADDMISIIHNQSNDIKNSALHSLVLYTYCYYARLSELPNLSFLESFQPSTAYTKEINNQPSNAIWIATLLDYGYRYTDDFDRILLSGVKCGHFDSTELLTQAKLLAADSKKNQAKDNFYKSFDIFHNSLTNNQAQVIDSIHSSFENNKSYLSVFDLNSVTVLLRYLNETDKANTLMDSYINAHQSNSESLNPDHLAIFPGIEIDDILMTRLRDIQGSKKRQSSLGDIFKSIKENSSWSDEDSLTIKNASEKDLNDLILNSTGDDLHAIIKYCLSIIPDKIKPILMKISKESKINELRLQKYLKSN